MKFSDLKFEPHSIGNGVQARHTFPNGYGVSVVRFRGMFGAGSYGVDAGLYEVAVLKGDRLCYATPITDDVLGHQSEDDVTNVMQQVAALPAN